MHSERMGAVVGVSYGGSFAWGAFAASSLVIGALMALRFRFSLRWIGLIMGFGSGVLISAVSFELIQESFDLAGGGGRVAFGVLAGCLVFFGGDELIDRLGGADRKDASGEQSSGDRAWHCARIGTRRGAGVDGHRTDPEPGRSGRGGVRHGRVPVECARGDLGDSGTQRFGMAPHADPGLVGGRRGGVHAGVASRIPRCSMGRRTTRSRSCSRSRVARS